MLVVLVALVETVAVAALAVGTLERTEEVFVTATRLVFVPDVVYKGVLTVSV